MTKRIVKKSMAINNPYNKRIVYVVDGVYIFPQSQRKKALNWIKTYDSKGRRKNGIYNHT